MSRNAHATSMRLAVSCPAIGQVAPSCGDRSVTGRQRLPSDGSSYDASSTSLKLSSATLAFLKSGSISVAHRSSRSASSVRPDVRYAIPRLLLIAASCGSSCFADSNSATASASLPSRKLTKPNPLCAMAESGSRDMASLKHSAAGAIRPNWYRTCPLRICILAVREPTVPQTTMQARAVAGRVSSTARGRRPISGSGCARTQCPAHPIPRLNPHCGQRIAIAHRLTRKEV